MKKLIVVLLFILLNSSYVAAQGGCDSLVVSERFDDLIYLLDHKDQLQKDLVTLDNQPLIADLLDGFNASLVSLQGKTSVDLIEAFIVHGAYQCGFDSNLINSFLDGYCSDIDVKAVNNTVELGLAAKAILNITNSPSTEITNKIKDSKIDNQLQIIISSVYSNCGDRLTQEVGVDIEITDPELDPDTPDFCATSPFANLSNFLWKPVSEKNGRLVILTNPATSVTVNGETLVEFGASNSFCSTLRASQSGASYGKAYVTLTTANQLYVIYIPNGIQRYDCRGSLSSCGIDVYDESELTVLKKKVKKLKKKMRKATNSRKKKRFKKKIKKLKPILKAAKSQGF